MVHLQLLCQGPPEAACLLYILISKRLTSISPFYDCEVDFYEVVDSANIIYGNVDYGDYLHHAGEPHSCEQGPPRAHGGRRK